MIDLSTCRCKYSFIKTHIKQVARLQKYYGVAKPISFTLNSSSHYDDSKVKAQNWRLEGY